MSSLLRDEWGSSCCCCFLFACGACAHAETSRRRALVNQTREEAAAFSQAAERQRSSLRALGPTDCCHGYSVLLTPREVCRFVSNIINNGGLGAQVVARCSSQRYYKYTWGNCGVREKRCQGRSPSMLVYSSF